MPVTKEVPGKTGSPTQQPHPSQVCLPPQPKWKMWGQSSAAHCAHATQVSAEQVASNQSWTLLPQWNKAQQSLSYIRNAELNCRPLTQAWQSLLVTGTKLSPLDSTSRQHWQNRADRNLWDSLQPAGPLLKTQQTHHYWFYLFIILSLIYLYLCISCFIPNQLHVVGGCLSHRLCIIPEWLQVVLIKAPLNQGVQA